MRRSSGCCSLSDSESYERGGPYATQCGQPFAENAYCTKKKNKKRKNKDGEGSSGVQLNTKKTRFLWTPNEHKKFVSAVKSLGCERAVPTKIMEVMGVEGLTRHIVASHLQKYRIQLRSGNQKEQAQDKLCDLHDFAPTLQQLSPEDLAFTDDDLPMRAIPHVEEPLPPLVDDIIGSAYEGLDEFPWGNSQEVMGLAANNAKNVQEEDADVFDQFFNFNGYLVDQKIKELEDFLFDDEACQL